MRNPSHIENPPLPASCGFTFNSPARRALQVVILNCVALACATAVSGQEAADLAKKLANPISSLISVPFQANYDDFQNDPFWQATRQYRCQRALLGRQQPERSRRLGARLFLTYLVPKG